MNNQPQKNVYKSRSGPAVIILLIVAGVAVNFALKSVVTALGLPMYLDCVGTVVAAALGGYMPGILVGFLTNVIIGLTDVPSLYYCSISVLIAVGAAFSAKRGGFRSIPGIILTTLLLTLIGGGIGSVLTWLLSGQDFGDVASSGLTKIVYSQGSLSPFASQLVADLTVDVVDKAVTVVLSAIVLALIPENAKDVLFMQGWKQAPLPEHMRSRVEERMYRIYSLRSKIVGFLAIAISVIGIVVTLISYTLYHGAILEQAETMGRSIANIAHSCIEPSRVDDYLTLGEKAPDYLEVEKELEQVKASSDDIEYVYVYRILEDGCHVVFDVDTADTPGGNPGDIVEFDESFDELLPKLLAGEPIDPIVTDDTFGWLLSVYKPVYDDAGKCMCYACIDISMNKLKVKEQVFFTRIISLFVGFFVVILAIGLWLAEYSIILPINTMALAAGAFAFNSESTRQESIEKIDSLQIVTGDEIENLYESVTKMGDDSMEFIMDSEKKAAQIEKMQSGLIYVLADLVESRDKLTGDHIRKTAAYVRIILDQVRREGLYRDVLTDEFCDDIINSAPLHDIGKIVVPDAILNKPGKLTDEEFAIMKTHAAAGGDILRQTVSALGEEKSGYLKEAINLASCHHEKWNGTGYPGGLSGENIPLSARIMAIADVFDALVSRRSYKEGFPFEKAMQIIEEGAGSHFDPVLAGAFIRASDKVREVAENYSANDGITAVKKDI